MGSGIAQVAATASYDTVVRDVSKDIWERARAGIEKSLAKLVEKGKLAAANRDAALKRLTFTTATAELQGCDIVVEAVTEDLELKNALWKELDGRSGSMPFAPWSTVSRACPTSTRRCSSGAATQWARSRCSTSWGSTRPTRSPRSCSPSTASAATRRPRSSNAWSSPA